MTSKPAPTKRQPSTTSSVPPVKPQCRVHSTALISEKAQLTGPGVIEIGENVIVHPHARIKAEGGNVVLGKGCIVSERAVVGLSEASDAGKEDAGGTEVVLGEGVSIESGTVVEARKIGEWSTVEINAKIGRGAVVGRWCKVGSLCEVKEKEVLEDFTVVFGENRRRVDGTLRDRREIRELKLKGREKEAEVLRSLIPDGSAKWRG